jgi:hypothetical protein
MRSKKKVTPSRKLDIIDPTLTVTEAIIDGKSYKMLLDFRALAQAQQEFNACGYSVNLFRSLDVKELDIIGLGALFAASLRRFQPELSLQEAQNLITLKNVWTVAEAVYRLWGDTIPAVGSEAVDPT